MSQLGQNGHRPTSRLGLFFTLAADIRRASWWVCLGHICDMATA
jgi:hypothetical protein